MMALRVKTLPAGICLNSETCSSQSSLLDVLGTRYPPPGRPFNKADDRYVDLFFGGNGTINAKVFIGNFVTNWETSSFTCEQDWLKLAGHSEGGAEGNNTDVDITSYHRKNAEGNIVVLLMIRGRTTNLFGLARSKIDDQAWIVFRRSE